MLAVLCVALAAFVVQRDPLPVRSTIQIDALPRRRWPTILIRTGIVCLLGSFVLLLKASYLLLD
ncbi:hypothetical protein CI15_29120 [Paraburkholderia monticola]|uniref:Uncharacterized protein n=2 Tax=Paraburkholderia monticola TaxID=1399968 RepID=A0A149PDR7_9BURK|nr:hypothetical protein CI15_29120 [Paraburkholderia monticola]